MVIQVQPDLYQIREPLVCSYLLLDGSNACLIDSGFVRGIKHLRTCLQQTQLNWQAISNLLLSHGHLDHTYNAATIQQRIPAPVWAHPFDARHISGKYPYRGQSRACGLLQEAGRILFGYTPPKIDRTLGNDQTIQFGGGIRVIHTPGHTEGHCCFLWEKHNLLFTGDLFATGRRRTFLPPAFLNSCPQHFPASLKRVLELNPDGMLSNHCDRAGPGEQKVRFLRLVKSLGIPR